MDVKDIENIVKNVKEQSNVKLIEARNLLLTEFNKTKELIVDLTKHLDAVGESYEVINKEIGNRIK
jgi:hypothetical protein